MCGGKSTDDIKEDKTLIKSSKSHNMEAQAIQRKGNIEVNFVLHPFGLF